MDQKAYVEMLVKRHQLLDDEADELSGKRYLMPIEKRKLKMLKVLRLRTRDEIDRLRRESEKLS